MTIPKNFKSLIVRTFNAQFEKIEEEPFKYYKMDKVPKVVTNVNDFYLGIIIGSLKFTLMDYFHTKYLRNLTEEELEEFDNIFIEYEDKFVKYIYT